MTTNVSLRMTIHLSNQELFSENYRSRDINMQRKTYEPLSVFCSSSSKWLICGVSKSRRGVNCRVRLSFLASNRIVGIFTAALKYPKETQQGMKRKQAGDIQQGQQECVAMCRALLYSIKAACKWTNISQFFTSLGGKNDATQKRKQSSAKG